MGQEETSWALDRVPTVAARTRLFALLQQMIRSVGTAPGPQGASALVDESCLFLTSPERAGWQMTRERDGLTVDVRVRVADIRIGFSLTREFRAIPDVKTLHPVDPPAIITRGLPDGRVWFETIYTNRRFADLVLLSRAMTGDTPAMTLVVDGLAFEILQIYAWLMEEAFIDPVVPRVDPDAEAATLRFRTSRNLESLSRQFRIPPSDFECLEETPRERGPTLWQVVSTRDAVEAIEQAIAQSPDVFQKDGAPAPWMSEEDLVLFDQEWGRAPSNSLAPPLVQPVPRTSPPDEVRRVETQPAGAAVRSPPRRDLPDTDQIGSGGGF